MNKYNKIYATSMTIIPIFLMGCILFFHIFSPDNAFSESENRILQQRPSISLGNILSGKFTSRYEKYISDQFPFRNRWIGIKSGSEKLIGKRENNDIFLGKDDYLLQKFNAPNTKTLKSRINTINSFGNALPDTNMYFMLVPNSVKIMEDKLPQNAPVDDELLYIHKIQEGLHHGIDFVDIYQTLFEHKDESIYYRTDHHWTTRGAYLGYRILIGVIGQTPKIQDEFFINNVSDCFYGSLYSKSGFRNINPDSIELYIPKNPLEYSVEYFDKNEKKNSIYYMENLKKKDKYTVFLGGNDSLVKITTDAHHDKKLMLIKDSYANSMVPFLIHHYKEIYLVDPRYYMESVKDLALKNHIDDVVIVYNVISFFEDNAVNNIIE